MSDPTEEGNKTVFRPSPLQGRRTGQTNFPGQLGPTSPGAGPPPVPQQPVWGTPAAAAAPAASPDDLRGTTALAPARAGGAALPFAPPAGGQAQGGSARDRPAAAPVKGGSLSAKSATPASRGAGATVIKVVLAIAIISLLALLLVRFLRPDLIPASLRLSDAGLQTGAPTASGQPHA